MVFRPNPHTGKSVRQGRAAASRRKGLAIASRRQGQAVASRQKGPAIASRQKGPATASRQSRGRIRVLLPQPHAICSGPSGTAPWPKHGRRCPAVRGTRQDTSPSTKSSLYPFSSWQAKSVWRPQIPPQIPPILFFRPCEGSCSSTAVSGIGTHAAKGSPCPLLAERSG